MQRIKKDSAFKSYQYFFKSSGSLQKILNTQEGEVDYQIELSLRNYKNNRDLRYTKPSEYSINNGEYFVKGETWQDLFINLFNLYSDKYVLTDGDIDFINSGSRKLLITEVNEEEKKLRKKLKNNLWLLVNFDSTRLCGFCFLIAEKLNLDLVIKLRPTKSRVEGSMK
jgi:hypothetical protein